MFLLLHSQLSPIERYAMRFVEETGAAWTAEQLRAAEEEIEAQKREWEANRLAALQKEEEMLKKEAEADEMLTYNRKDASNQVNNKNQGSTIRTKTMIKTNRRVLKQKQQQQRFGRGGKVTRLGRGNSSGGEGVKRAVEVRKNSVLGRRSPVKNRRGAGSQSLRGRAVGVIRNNNIISHMGSSRSRGNSVEHERVAKGSVGNARAMKRASSPTASDEAEEETATTTNTMKSTRKTTRTSMAAAAAVVVNVDTDDDDKDDDAVNDADNETNKLVVVGTKRNATGVKNQSLLNRRRLLQQRKQLKATAAANMRKCKIIDGTAAVKMQPAKRNAADEKRALVRIAGKRRQLRSSQQQNTNKARLRTYSHKQSVDEQNDIDEDDDEDEEAEGDEDEEGKEVEDAEEDEEAVATANDDDEDGEEVEQTASDSERSDNEEETVEEVEESADEAENDTADNAVSADDDTENGENQYDSARSHCSDDAEEQSEAAESEEVEDAEEHVQVSKTKRIKATLRKNSPVKYYTPRRKYNSRTSNISPPPQATADAVEVNNSDGAAEDDSQNEDAASYVTVLDTVEDIDDEFYENEHGEPDMDNDSESETEKANAHAAHAYANERQRRRRNDSDAPTNSNSLDVWNAHTQIHDTTTTNSTYYNVSDETDSEENETPLARLHHTSASASKRGAAAMGNLSTISKTSAAHATPSAIAMHQNHVDVNSPRTRSRGAVKINLWTLDVSPVLPPVSRMTKKQRSRLMATKDASALAYSSNKGQLEEPEDMMTSTASAEEDHLMDSDAENATSNHKTKLAHATPTATTVRTPNSKAHITNTTKTLNAVAQRKRLPKVRVAATSIRSGTTTLHRWLLKTPKSTTTRAADMGAASDMDEQDATNDLLDPLADNSALSSVDTATAQRSANRSSNGPT